MKPIAVALALALCGLPLAADDWPAPVRKEVFSENGLRFVRILPGESIGETVGFSGAKKGRHATAQFYFRQPDLSYKLVAEAELVNPVAPVDVMLSNSGALITFDNWHNAGYGKVVAIYSPDGELRVATELEGLYSQEQLEKVSKSVSSRWWRCRPFGWSDPGEQSMVYAHDRLGGYFVFDLTVGSHRYTSGSAACSDQVGL